MDTTKVSCLFVRCSKLRSKWELNLQLTAVILDNNLTNIYALLFLPKLGNISSLKYELRYAYLIYIVTVLAKLLHKYASLFCMPIWDRILLYINIYSVVIMC